MTKPLKWRMTTERTENDGLDKYPRLQAFLNKLQRFLPLH